MVAEIDLSSDIGADANDECGIGIKDRLHEIHPAGDRPFSVALARGIRRFGARVGPLRRQKDRSIRRSVIGLSPDHPWQDARYQ